MLVGIYSDFTIQQQQQQKGASNAKAKASSLLLPFLNNNERLLSLLGCRYVDDVVVDAPYVVSSEMIQMLGIDEVVYAVEEDEDDTGRRAVTRRRPFICSAEAR